MKAAGEPGSEARSQRARKFFVSLNGDARRLSEEVWQSESVRECVKENVQDLMLSQTRALVESVVVHFFDKIGNLEKEIGRQNILVADLKSVHHQQTRAHFKEMVNLKNQLRLLPRDRLEWAEGRSAASLVFFEPLALLDASTRELVKDVLTEKLSEVLALYPRAMAGDASAGDSLQRLARLNKDLETQLADANARVAKLDAKLATYTATTSASLRRSPRKPIDSPKVRSVTVADANALTVGSFLEISCLPQPAPELARWVSRNFRVIDVAASAELRPVVTQATKAVNTEIASAPAALAQEIANPPRPTPPPIPTPPPRPQSAQPQPQPQPQTAVASGNSGASDAGNSEELEQLREEAAWYRGQLEILASELGESRSLVEALQTRLASLAAEQQTREVIGNLANVAPHSRQAAGGHSRNFRPAKRPDTAPETQRREEAERGDWQVEEGEAEISVEEAARIPYAVRAQWPQYAGRRRDLLYDDFLCDLEKEKEKPPPANSGASDVEQEQEQELLLEHLRRKRRPSSSFFFRFLRGREEVAARGEEAKAGGGSEDQQQQQREQRPRPQSCPPTLHHVRGGGWRLARELSRPSTTTTAGGHSLVRGNRPQSRIRFLLREDEDASLAFN